MVLSIIFLVSGICIALLLFTKVRENRARRTPLLLRVISLGDERMKDLSHRSAHFYADSKESAKFFLEKQLPLHTKRIWGKTETYLREKGAILVRDIRSMKIFKKDGSLSEYFQARADSEQQSDAGEPAAEAPSAEEDRSVE